MALTKAEKQRRYRERQRERVGEEVLKQKDAERKRLARAKDKDADNEKARDRMRTWRAAKKAENNKAKAYSTPSSLNRAVKRTLNTLPQSPRKRRKVVTKLTQQFEAEYSAEPEAAEPEQLPPPPPANKIPDEIRNRIQEFYLRSDISWTAPGRKDSITVVRDGKKVKEQRHYLLMTIQEAFALYKEENPNDSVKLTSFKSFRPDVVLFRSDMPHNVCVCQYHENVNLILQGLGRINTIPDNHKLLLRTLCCDIDNENCIFGKCETCQRKISTDSLAELVDDDELLSENAKWFKWIRTDEGKMAKVEETGTVNDALQLLADKLPAFKIHCFIKSKQAAEFVLAYSNPRPNHAVMQIDFSENAAIIEQDEVQSAHWSHIQVTIFTAVAWIMEDTKSYCITSDTQSHDKYTAAVFLNTLIDNLRAAMPGELTDLDIFSDGAGQHFKQKYMFLFISSLLESKGIRIHWHFFATSHGKGAVDGIGGTVKRTVFSGVKSRRYHITNAEEYASCAKELLKSTTILHVSSAEINDMKPELDKLWGAAITVPGTHNVHCVRTISHGVVSVSNYSRQVGSTHCLLPQAAIDTQDTTFKPENNPSDETPIPDETPIADETPIIEYVPSQSVPDPSSEEEKEAASFVVAGKWYAVYWEKTHYWFIGQALHEHKKDKSKWVFSFLEQVDEETNGFKTTNDIDSAKLDHVLAEIDAPAPSSSTRTSLLKLTATDFNLVREMFANFL